MFNTQDTAGEDGPVHEQMSFALRDVLVNYSLKAAFAGMTIDIVLAGVFMHAIDSAVRHPDWAAAMFTLMVDPLMREAGGVEAGAPITRPALFVGLMPMPGREEEEEAE